MISHKEHIKVGSLSWKHAVILMKKVDILILKICLTITVHY